MSFYFYVSLCCVTDEISVENQSHRCYNTFRYPIETYGGLLYEICIRE